jgi:hypothetical protein
MKIDDKISIKEDPTHTEYAVRGIDPISNRIWLATTDACYEAYDGDLIVCPRDDGSYDIALADGRTSLPRHIHVS